MKTEKNPKDLQADKKLLKKRIEHLNKAPLEKRDFYTLTGYTDEFDQWKAGQNEENLSSLRGY